mmetsp:Transcript_4367/g.8746  ORF Transcript_4367/g.8746 Transcript_4367/m.8746 type:complete len:336 (-) Transcript_4367:167-1174(-)
MEKGLRNFIGQAISDAGLGKDAGLVGRAVTPSAASAWEANRAACRPGSVQCLNFFAARGGRRPELDGFVSVYVAKGFGEIGNQLSPFFLPVPPGLLTGMTVDGSDAGKSLFSNDCKNVPLELWWQSAKVCDHELIKDGGGVPGPNFFSRRAAIYSEGVAKRRYVRGGIAGAWLGGTLVPWVESRVWYCTAYEHSAAMTCAFAFLQNLVVQGVNLLLLGPDGFPLGSGADSAPSDNGLDAVYHSEDHPFGHERVLVAMLRGQRPWSNAAKIQHALQPLPQALVELAALPPVGRPSLAVVAGCSPAVANPSVEPQQLVEIAGDMRQVELPATPCRQP